MEPKSPQFSAYDFLGYLLPGLVFMALADCTWLYHVKPCSFSLEFLVKRYSELSWNNAIPLALLGYFFGHMVSFCSSIIIEGHAKRMHGEPSTLGIRNYAFDYFHAGKWRAGRRVEYVSLIFFRFVRGVVVFPIGWIECIFARMLSLSKRFNGRINSILLACLESAEQRLLERLGVDAKIRLSDGTAELQWGNGLERLGLHYALETASAHVTSLRNYVVLYGFLRSMTFILLISAWTVSVHLFLQNQWMNGFVILVSSGLLIAPCYCAFLKLWTRYHREALMAFLAATAKNSPLNESQASKPLITESSA